MPAKGQRQTPEARDKIRVANTGYRHTPEARAKMSAAKKGYTPWNKGIHMWGAEDRQRIGIQGRGRIPWNKGKPLTPEHRQALIVARRKRPPHSEETKAKMSASHLAKNYRGRGHHLFGVTPPHRKRCVYRGVVYRSTYEVRFAQMLQRNRVKFAYEPRTFDLGSTTYTPDFYLSRYRLWCEVKGWLTAEAEKKLSLFRSRYPKERLAMFPKEFFRKRLDQSNTLNRR